MPSFTVKSILKCAHLWFSLLHLTKYLYKTRVQGTGFLWLAHFHYYFPMLSRHLWPLRLGKRGLSLLVMYEKSYYIHCIHSLVCKKGFIYFFFLEENIKYSGYFYLHPSKNKSRSNIPSDSFATIYL